MNTNIHFYLLLVIMLSLISCNTTSYLKEDQRYVKENEITYESNKLPAEVTDKLPYLIKLKPNKGFLWASKRWFYIKNERKPKNTWFRNFIMENIAEEPAILKSEKLKSSTISMENYMKNQGFFNADVHTDIDSIGKHNAKVIYHVIPGKRTYMDSFLITSLDTALLQIIEKDWRNKVIKDGSAVDQDLYSAEVTRLVKLFKNNGYPYFGASYISNIQLDTTEDRNTGRIIVKRPAKNINHPVFRNNQVYVYPKYSAENIGSSKNESTIDTVINNINFIGSEEEYGVRRKVIANKISLKENEIFRQDNYERTLRQIGEIPFFGFPAIKLDYDTLNQDFKLDYNLFMKTNPRYLPDGNIDFFYSNIRYNESSINLIGFNAGASLLNRNAFGGAEALTNSLNGSIELDPSRNSYQNSYFFSSTNKIEIPQFIRFPFFYSIVDWIAGMRDSTQLDINAIDFPTTLYQGAKTKIALNYSYQRRALNYRTHQFTTSFGYTWKMNENTNYYLDHIGIDWLLPEVLEDYDMIVNNNEYLRRTFQPRLLTGFLFRRIGANHSKTNSLFNETFKTNIEIEASGLEILLLEKAASVFNARTPFAIDSTRFAKYIRLEVTPSYTKHYTENSTLALRFNVGAAISLNGEEIPYFKQFYVGGPYSIRAWPVRGLGPGGFIDSTIIDSKLPFYQTGDFKLEMNAEYRFKLFWYFHGAVFLDIGNVWHLRDTDSYGENAELDWDSYKQFSIGSGLGLRLDFNNLIVLRLDAGYPIRSPYLGPDNYWQTVQDFKLKNVQLNIAFGYPF